jgi:hypothetical protein
MIPCQYAIKFLTSIKMRPEDYCDEMHTVNYLKNMYNEAFSSRVTVINDLHQEPLRPPVVEVLRGRKKKNRIESQSIQGSDLPFVQFSRAY